MNELFQIFLLIIAVAYKGLLARHNIWGWILGAASSFASIIYIYIYLHLPLLVCLEFTFLLLALYGAHKHKENLNKLTRVDWWIISLAAVAIISLLYVQLRSDTVWYEATGSASFLIGVIFLAQKNHNSKIIGWLCFMTGSVMIGIVNWEKEAYVLAVGLHFLISQMIGIVAIIQIRKTRNKMAYVK